jgi:diguanylate cyclase (GGDEF)-like protein
MSPSTVPDKRRHVRQRVRLDGHVRFPEGRSLACEIRDFCAGGVFLTLLPGMKVSARRDLPVTVLFGGDGGVGAFQLTGRIAHVAAQGLGIAFLEPPAPAALAALRDKVALPATGRAVALERGEPDSQLSALNRICRQALEAQLSPVLADFFAHVSSVLLDAAAHAGTNAEQATYFEAMSLLKAHRREIEQRFSHHVLQQAETFEIPPSEPCDTSDGGQLGLVDSGTFEDWLNVNEEIARLENQHLPELQRMEQRFTWLAHREVNRRNNPYGPCVIEHAFRSALSDLQLDNAPKRLIYRVFGRVLDPRLGDLYQRLDEITGRLVPGTLESSIASRRLPAADSGPAREAPAEVAPPRRPKCEPDVRPTPYAAAGALLQLCAQSHPSLSAGLQPDSRATASVIQALRRLQARMAAQRVDYVQTSSIEAELAQDLASAPAPLPLGEVERQTIETLGALMDSVLAQDWIPVGIRPFFQDLQIPLLEAALADSSLIHGESHPARDVVNLMERLALAANARGELENSPLRQALEELTARIAREAVDHPGVFQEAKAQLEKLTAPLLKARARQLARLQETCEAKGRLEAARNAVGEAINARIAGRLVPSVVLQLLDAGWRQLLVLTALREGAESQSWLSLLAVLDRLLLWLAPENTGKVIPALEAHRLIGSVDEALSRVCPEPLVRNRISLELTAVLLGKRGTGERRPAELVPVPSGTSQDGTPAGLEESPPLPALRVGDWLEFAPGLGVRTPLRLGWVGDRPSRYVFTDYQGHKELELSGRQLAQYLRDGQASIGEDRELPLLERAASHLVQSMQEKLRYQASHDAVTGLINRREFIRQLPARLSQNRHGVAFHLLCMLHVSQLRVINNLCGVEAGDRLLKEICVILRASFKGDHLLARLGDSSFGMLFSSDCEEASQRTGEAMLRAIADHHFRWGEHHFTLAASLGMAMVPGAGGDPEALLKNADAACMAAREQGPNRLQIYSEGDSTLEARRQVMEWAGRIDSLLAQERLTARCQKIAPIFPERDPHSHYEVLLGVQDASGQPLSPYEFVVAAEHWNRVSEIDRWQVQSALAWIRGHAEVFAKLGGFSINLSGQSLNSESFLDFLHEELAWRDVPADKITFEITETAAVSEFGRAGRFIRQIRRHGCRFSLDDFGSGFSSYSYLKNLEVDYLKIDGSFVRDLAESATDYALVKSMNDIAHSLGIKTIAEYVESEPILDKLREIGVDYAQGYAVQKPVPMADLEASV